jgi:5'-methylthioinosine phosphorylase
MTQTAQTRLAMIGGSSLDQLAVFEDTRRIEVDTPYGKPSSPLIFGKLNQREVVFLARHGERHQWPPHRINYRANLWALHAQGVTDVVAVATVGGIGAAFHAGALAVPDQIIDYTWGRESTFFDGESKPGEGNVKHIDFTKPYDEALRTRVLQAARRVEIPMLDGGTYATTQGPRLETAAEIQRLARDGAHMVGMTGMPEAALARELGLRYACLALVVNAAAGTGQSKRAIDLSAAEALAREAMARVVHLLMTLAAMEVNSNGD